MNKKIEELGVILKSGLVEFVSKEAIETVKAQAIQEERERIVKEANKTIATTNLLKGTTNPYVYGFTKGKIQGIMEFVLQISEGKEE